MCIWIVVVDRNIKRMNVCIPLIGVTSPHSCVWPNTVAGFQSVYVAFVLCPMKGSVFDIGGIDDHRLLILL